MKHFFFAACVLSTSTLVAACSDEGPSSDQIQSALELKTSQIFAGCPYFKYTNVNRKSADPIDGRDKVFKVTADYDFTTFAEGHDLLAARDSFQNSHMRPDWFPQSCVDMMENGMSLGTPEASRRAGMFMQRAYARANVSGEDLQKLSPQAIMQNQFHVTGATLHFRKSDKDQWRLVDE